MATAESTPFGGEGTTGIAPTVEPAPVVVSQSPMSTRSPGTSSVPNLATLLFHRPLTTVPQAGIEEVARMLRLLAREIEAGHRLNTRQVGVPDEWEIVRRDGSLWVAENGAVFDHAETIPGWYSRAGLEQLANLAYGVAEPHCVFMEIGVWKGRSAYVLGSLLQQKVKLGRLYAVDTFRGLPEKPNDERYGGTDFLQETRQNLAGLPVEFFQVPSSTYVPSMFSPGVFSLVHVDGDHGYPVAEQDIFNGWWLLKAGGLLCGDDYNEVKPSVDRLAKAFDTKVLTFGEKLWWTYR